MTAFSDIMRARCKSVVEEEARFALTAALDDAAIEQRQLRLREAEFASRLRGAVDDLETFLNAQGRLSERDIVSDSARSELEVKYFCSASPQGAQVALSDFRWLVGEEDRTPHRPYSRLWACFFPRACSAHGVQNRAPQPIPSSYWRFQDCLSFSATTLSDVRPFWPVVALVKPSGGQVKHRLAFRTDWTPRSILHQSLAGRVVFVRCDVFGDPFHDPVWSIFYEPILDVQLAALVAAGYVVLDPR